MKKTTLLAILLAGLSFCCKKSNSSASYHLTATIDGQARAFNTNLTATWAGSNIAFSGASSATSSPGEELLFALIGSPQQPSFPVGSYPDTASGFDVQATYRQTLTSQYEAGTPTAGTALVTGKTITNHFTLIITAIDTVSIKGTFSGDYFLDGSPANAKVTITNGDFYAKFR
ncbi:MAG TPA: hypothetical protein VG052_05655 [Puia sp.]|jgi:hypothetical protein|nr:hypothetical protein [Puia sp.]